MGLDAQLVLSSLLTKDVFSLVVMTQTGSIPYHELPGCHVGSEKQTFYFNFTLHSVALKVLFPICYPFLCNTELGMHLEMKSESQGKAACQNVT